MSGEKGSATAAQDDEIEHINEDFQNILSEMSEMSNVGDFVAVFQRMHELFKDSHGKNQRLTNVVQALNSQIISNATKVASLLKMSDNDRASIDRYKEEYEKAWRLVSASQGNEVTAREACESLKKKVSELTAGVHDQTVNENTFKDLSVDVNTFMDEMATHVREIEVLREDVSRGRACFEEAQTMVEQSRAVYRQLRADIHEEEERIKKMKEFNVSLQADMDKVVADNKGAEQEKIDISNEMQKRKDAINAARLEVVRYRGIFRDYEIEAEELKNGLKRVVDKRDRIQSSIEKNLKKIHHMTLMNETADVDLEATTKKDRTYDEIMSGHREELQLFEARRVQVLSEVESHDKKVDELLQIRGHCVRQHGKDEMQIHQVTRINDAAIRKVEMERSHLSEAATGTEETVTLAKMSKGQIVVEKGAIQALDLAAISAEKEMKAYERKKHESQVQTVRIADTMSILRSDIAHIDGRLEELARASKSHDASIRDMKQERDVISNMIDGVLRDNKKLEADVHSKREQLVTLKQEIQNGARACIEIHFKTRSLEKGITALTGAVKMTERLCVEAQSTIVGYKAEGAKLRVVYETAVKDIAQARAEARNLTDMIRMLERQLCNRRDEIDKAAEEAATTRHLLVHNATSFERQTDGMITLQAELDAALFKNRILNQKNGAALALALQEISITSQIDHQQALRNSMEHELTKPRNVHRWETMKIMAPDQYKSIQMVQWLKARLENVYREKVKLLDTKKKLSAVIEEKETRLRNLRIADGSYAISTVKGALSKKDNELKSMEAELNERKNSVTEMEEVVTSLRLRVKQSRIATTSLKRQQQQIEHPEVPMLMLGPRLQQRTRLGGGFDLSGRRDDISGGSAQSRPQTARVVRVTRQMDDQSRDSGSGHVSARDVVTASKLDKKKKTKTRKQPLTARPSREDSWKASKGRDSLTRERDTSLTVSSSRPKSDLRGAKELDLRVTKDTEVVRRRVVQTSMGHDTDRFNRRTERSSSVSSRSGSSSARSTAVTATVRPGVKVHTKVIEF